MTSGGYDPAVIDFFLRYHWPWALALTIGAALLAWLTAALLPDDREDRT